MKLDNIKKIKIHTRVSLGIILVLLPIVVLSIYKPGEAEATWFNDAWSYRQRIPIDTHTAAETNVYNEMIIDTATLTTDKLQADCDDLRFTDANGKLLPYQIVSGCDSTSTTIRVGFDTMPAAPFYFYMYYGNPSASMGSSTLAHSACGNGCAEGTSGSEEKGTGPIAYWAMDEGYGSSTNDSSSNNNDVAISGAAWRNEDFCLANKCLYFDGTDDVATVTNATAVDLNESLASGFTFSAWIRPNGAGEGNGGQVFFKGTNTWMRVDTLSGGNLDIQASLDLATADATLNVSAKIASNKWNYIALSYTDDGDDEITIYVNGVSGGTSTDGNGSPNNDTANLLVGGNTTDNFKGFIDEFKIYNYERSAAQIKTDFSSRETSEGASAIFGTTNNKALSDGLVGYWPMDETAANSCTGGTNDTCDKSGNGFDGAWANNTAAIGGKFANGTDYDGTNDSISVSDNDAFSVSTTNKLTVSAWIYPDSNSGTRQIITKGTTSNFEWSLGSNANLYQILIWSSSGSVIANLSLSQGFQANQWQHFAFTIDLSTNTAVAYRNGVVAASATISGTYTNGTAAVRFGERADGSNDFDGKIDEVRIYNRILSDKEITALYNWAPGPVGYYKLDEGSGTSIFDSSGNGYAATAVNNFNSGSWENGKFGDATKFVSASSQDVRLNPTSTLFPNTNSWSYGLWLKRNSTDALSADEFIFSQQGATYRAGSVFLRDSDDTLTFNYRAGGSHNYVSLANLSTIGTTWQHVMVTYDGTTYTGYLNGVLTATATAAQDTFDSNSTSLGSDLGSSYANVLTDEIRIYNYPRSAQQVVEDMNGGHPAGGSPISSQVAYWAFDEQYGATTNNQNSAQSSLTGSISGATWKTKENCKINGCLDFDGSNDVATVTNADPIDLNVGLAASLTMGAWIYADSDGEGDTGQIFYKGAATYCRTDTESASRVDIECSLDLATTDATLNISSAIATGSWNHVMVSYTDDSDDEITIWINGKNRGSSTNGNGAPAADANDLLIGGTTTANFDGKIDEFKIYSSELTAEQVRIDMSANAVNNFGVGSDEATQITDGAGNPPVGYWNFDEKTGTTANDRSGNDRAATITDAGGTVGGWTAGKIGASFDMRGNNDADIIDITDFSLGTSNTITFWVNFYDLGGSGGANDAVVGGKGAAAGEGYMFYADGTNVYSRQALASGVSVSATFANDTWYHISIVRSGASITFYRNGVQLGSTQTYGSNNSFTLGTLTNFDIGTTSFPLEGKIDEVKIYDYARTPAQVAYDFNRGAPVAWWQFDECSGTTANDASGNSYAGTITIGVTDEDTVGNCATSSTAWGSGATGKFNSSLSFDGDDDYTQISDTANLRFDSASADFSVFAWLKRAANGEMNIISKEDADNDGWRLQLTSGNAVRCSVDAIDIDSTITITDTNWHHIGCTIDRDGNGQVYIDGKANGTATAISSEIMANTSNMRIGTRSYTPTNYLDGLIDDVRIYNYPLSATQIKKLYNDNAGARFGPATGSP